MVKESLDGIFSQLRKKLKLAQRPRENVVRDMDEGKVGQICGGKQVTQKNSHV